MSLRRIRAYETFVILRPSSEKRFGRRGMLKTVRPGSSDARFRSLGCRISAFGTFSVDVRGSSLLLCSLNLVRGAAQDALLVVP